MHSRLPLQESNAEMTSVGEEDSAPAFGIAGRVEVSLGTDTKMRAMLWCF